MLLTIKYTVIIYNLQNNKIKKYIYIYIKEESHYSILQIFDMFMAKKSIQKPGAYEQ